MPIKLRAFWIRAPEKYVKYIKAVVHQEVLISLSESLVSTALGQFIGLISGKGSTGGDDGNPIPSAALGSGLMSPTAIFRGVKRPLNKAKDGEDIFCYVTNPKQDYKLDIEFLVKNTHLAESERLRLIPIKKPDYSSLVSFVRTDTLALDEARPHVDDPLGEVQAVVTGWEWTLAMPDDSGLPFDHPNRYIDRII